MNSNGTRLILIIWKKKSVNLIPKWYLDPIKTTFQLWTWIRSLFTHLATQMTGSILLNLQFPSVTDFRFRSYTLSNHLSSSAHLICSLTRPRISRLVKVTAASSMEVEQEQGGKSEPVGSTVPPMKLLFVEMGVGYDQHG